MLNPVSFASLDELDAAVTIDPTLRQTSGTRRVCIAGTSYRVDFDNSSVSTQSSSFVVRSREQWQATEEADAPMELRIAHVMFSPRQDELQQEEPPQQQPQHGKGKRKKPKFKPLDLWSKAADDVAGKMEKLSLDEQSGRPQASAHSSSRAPTRAPRHHRADHRGYYFETATQKLWLLEPEAFKAHIAELSLEELVQMGGCLRTNILALPLKKLFADRLLSFDEQAFAALHIHELAQLQKPYTDPDSFSVDLLNRIGNRAEVIFKGGDIEQVHIHDAHTIYKCMVQVGFQHRCMMPMARYFAGQALLDMDFNPEYVLNNMRCMMMDHLLVARSARHRQAEELKQLLMVMYGQLDEFLGSFEPTERRLTLAHWIRIYGRYILGLEINTEAPPPKNRARESNLQRQIEEMLREQLPEVPFESEKRLPDLQLDVDLYCEPRIVVEVYGHAIHYAINLDMIADNDPDPWDRRTHSQAIYAIRTASLLKERLLKAAGYTLYTLTNNKHARIQAIVKDIRRRRRSSAPQTHQAPTELPTKKITLLRRPESSPSTTASPPEAPSTSAAQVTAPAPTPKVTLLRRPQPTQPLLQATEPPSPPAPPAMLDPTASQFVPRVYQSGLQQPQPYQQPQPQAYSQSPPYPQPQPYQQQQQPQIPTMPPPGFPFPSIPAPPSVDLPPGMQLVLGPDGLWHCVPVNPHHWPPPH